MGFLRNTTLSSHDKSSSASHQPSTHLALQHHPICHLRNRISLSLGLGRSWHNTNVAPPFPTASSWDVSAYLPQYLEITSCVRSDNDACELPHKGARLPPHYPYPHKHTVDPT